MTEIAEGLGAVIEGSLAAKAVEPDAGDVNGNPPATIDCPNCGTNFAGNYCPNCGQKANTHRTLTAIAHDLIHGVLHLDGKLSHALPLLLFKPGRLTRRYIDGERAKFVSPMSMFLFGVFAMFAVFQMVGLTTPTSLDLSGPAQMAMEKGEGEMERLQREIDALPPDDPIRAEREEQRALIGEMIEKARNGENLPEDSPFSNLSWQINDTDTQLTGVDWIDQGIIKKWNENPGLVLYKLQANGYKFSWLLIPLSIPFVWVAFLWRRKFKAYDHAIFVTYSLSFMSLLFITVSLIALNPWGGSGGWAFALFAIAAPLHLYKHIKYTYGLSRFSALWRFFFLLFSMIFILVMFLNSLLVIGAF